MKYVRENNYKFLGNRPDIFAALNADRLNAGQLLNITEFMEQQKAADEVARKQAEEAAAWERTVAENKAKGFDPASLTAGYVRQ